MSIEQKELHEVLTEVQKIIVGQDDLLRDVVISLLCEWHILLEWAPGLAKTLTVNTFAQVLSLTFSRIQFTPDLLPSDLIGAKIYDPEAKKFEVRKGPVFANFVLADEINRAPSKVQSALLEAMEESQVTIGDKSFSLKKPFMVLATQNPIEQEGTFSLPEAQLDRFLLKSIVEYPTEQQELEIMNRDMNKAQIKLNKIVNAKQISELQAWVQAVHVSENILEYIKDIVFATRSDDAMRDMVLYGASPRASLALLRASRALAYLEGRDFVMPEDVKEMALPVLRHRIILQFEAIANDITTDKVIERILESVKIK